MTWAYIAGAVVVFGGIAGIYLAGWRASSKNRDAKEFQRSAEQAAVAKGKEQKRVTAHEKRIEGILTDPHSPDDVSRMLSEFPADAGDGKGDPKATAR